MKRYKNMIERVIMCYHILRHTRASIARVTVVSSAHTIADCATLFFARHFDQSEHVGVSRYRGSKLDIYLHFPLP